MSVHHHGKVIKEYRELHCMTQAELAEKWPKSDGSIGVSTNFVHLVEAGKREIVSSYTLRGLCDLLDIPLWKFGLSEYDPFNPSLIPGYGRRMFKETLDVVEALIKQTLAMRRVAPLPEVQRNAQILHNLLSYFLTYTPPGGQLEPRFYSLFAQEMNLGGLMFFENKQYDKALTTFEDMYRLTKDIGDPTLIMHSLAKLGVELKRVEKHQEAIQALEKARDVSFQCSKHVAAYANAYLAHVYAGAGEALRFERTIDTAISLATPIQGIYGDGTDFVFHKFSGILQLKSRGYLRIGEPQKTLALHEELKRQIAQDDNLWLDFRLHLYQAQAYLMLNEIEACIESAREFFRDVVDWHSPHRTSRGYELLQEIEKAGYGDVKEVKDFKADLLHSMSRNQ